MDPSLASGNVLGGSQGEPTPMYTPAAVEATRTHRFLDRVNAKYGLALQTYVDLFRWSTSDIAAFWSDVWDETEIIGHKGAHVVDAAALPPANPPWFADARLNWAENMLRCRAQHKVALIEASTSPAAVCYLRA